MRVLDPIYLPAIGVQPRYAIYVSPLSGAVWSRISGFASRRATGWARESSFAGPLRVQCALRFRYLPAIGVQSRYTINVGPLSGAVWSRISGLNQ
jgi:hypothetical protein